MNRPKFPRRAYRRGNSMTAAEFWTVTQLIRMWMPNREAARRVLVDGISHTQAGEEFGLSRQSVGNSVKRVETAHNLILAGYFPPRPEPKE